MYSNEVRHYRFLCVVLALADALAALSLWHYIRFSLGLQSEPSFCNLSAQFNCDAVTRSSYSLLFGIPVAVYGMLFYTAMLLTVGFSLRGKDELPLARISGALCLCAIGSVLYSFYLFYVSEFIIGTVCPTCMAMYACNFLFLLLSWRALRSPRGESLRGGFAALFSGLPKLLFLRQSPSPASVEIGRAHV